MGKGAKQFCGILPETSLDYGSGLVVEIRFLDYLVFSCFRVFRDFVFVFGFRMKLNETMFYAASVG